MRISIAIPSLDRGAILCRTIERLLSLRDPADALLVVDQTREHPPHVDRTLTGWNSEGRIRWMCLDRPSIPHAMNVALTRARTELVLFLDDDIEPSDDLVAEHRAAHGDESVWAVVGQVLQPGEEPVHFPDPHGSSAVPDLEFRFNHDEPQWVRNVMAGNLSVRREKALAVGGFDENFVGVAHRFETDFALRLAAAGGRIRYQPSASIRHLKLSSGGLRSYGDHRRSASPAHSVGDYYFALHHAPRFWPYALRRLRSNVLTRHLARHPWLIPSKLAGELRGIGQARRLAKGGRKLLAKGSS